MTSPPDPVEPDAVPIRDAATVVLLRDGRAGLEVFLQQRASGMPFAAGMTVFPGGSVDVRDAEATLAWHGPPPAEWAELLDCAPPVARALVCAAVRETFEESGVLLASDADGTIVYDTGSYAYARSALVSGELSLAAFLAEEALVLRADLLRAWAHWLTPEGETRRYDTRFFVAPLPAGQRADDQTTEVHSCGWQEPAGALADADAGRGMVLPPTWSVLTELAGHGSVSEVLTAPRSMGRVTPRIVHEGDNVRIVVDGAQCPYS